MINMQQTILNQVSGTEQPQEEVELTELLPVKQSRIRENSVFKDADTTDALKVLRSFTGGCNDDQEFHLETFHFSGKVDRHIKMTNKQQRKKLGRCRSVVQSSETERNEEMANQQFNTESIKKKVRTIGKRNVGRMKLLKKKILKTIKKKAEIADETGRSKHEAPVSKTAVEDDGILSEFDDDEVTYLELDKNKEFKDEVYVFRREEVNTCSSPQPKQGDANQESIAFGNGYSSADTLFHPNPCKEKKEINDVISDKENEGNLLKVAANESDSTKTGLDRELSLNISSIIQANFIFQQENNNVMQLNQNKLQGSSSSSPTSLSTLTEGLSCLSDESSSMKQIVDARQDSQDKKYCCVVCDARFKGSGGLRNHYKILHGAGPTFKCDECGKEFPLKERLKLHVRTHTGFKPYKCPECDKSFARGGQLVQHRRTHSQVKPYSCAICSGTFTCAANLALHVKRHNGQKDHKCEICGRAFVRRDALKKHLECLHQDVKSFLCVICNKTFKGHLPQHMRTHARDRPHGCATCGQRFAQKSQLTVHQRTHSGQRPFRCLVCWQAFAHSTALKLHTRRHTGERPFKCSECNAGFTQLPHWKKHMKCIHGRNEPYACKKCKSFFRIKNDLESHEKICHPESVGNVDGISSADGSSNEGTEKGSPNSKYKVMTVEKMRLLLAVLLKRISRQERLDELGFGKRLIDEVLQDSLISAGKDPVTTEGLTELEALSKNLETFLEWTVPREHWDTFRRLKKTPEDILETLTST